MPAGKPIQLINDPDREDMLAAQATAAAAAAKAAAEAKAAKDATPIGKLAANIIAQGSMKDWSTGSGLSKEDAAYMMAEKLYNDGGITRLEDFGKIPVKETVPVVTGHYEVQAVPDEWGGYSGQTQNVFVEGSGQQGYMKPTPYTATDSDGRTFEATQDVFTPFTQADQAQVKDGKFTYDTGQTVYGNKVTGQAIPVNYDRAGMHPDTWGGTFAGDSSSGFGVQFNKLGMPIFYTHYDVDNGPWGAILSIASMVPGPQQPFLLAANAALSYSQGNTTGAILSALGSVAGFMGSGLEAVNGMDLQSDIATLGYNPASVVGGIQTAQQAVGVMKSLSDRNFAGIISSLVNLAPQIGVTIPEDLIKPVQMAAVGSALSRGDWAAAAGAAGTLTNNSDLTLAGKGINLVNALKNPNNPAGIISSLLGFAQQAGFDSSVIKNTATQAGLPLSDANVTKLMQSTVPSETDKMLNNWLSEAKQVRSAYETTFGKPISDELLSQLNGENGFISGYNSYVNTDQGRQDYNTSPAKVAADEKAITTQRETQTQNIKDYYKQVLGRDATPDELKNFLGEFGGIDKAIAEATKRNTVTIATDEAASLKDASTLAKLRDPYATQFTYGGTTYQFSASDAQMQQAYKEAKLNEVSTAKTFNEAFAAARDLKAQGILGANEPFTWNGQTFNTNLAKTPTEASAFDANTVFKAKSALIDQLADTKSWQGANLSSGELAKFTDAFANATPEQRASMLKGSDAATYKIINDALTTTKQSVDATQIAIKNGTLDLTKPVTGSGSISANNATNYLEVVKNIGNNVATDLASTALSGANAVGTLLGMDTSEIKNLQKFMSDDQKKQMDKLVGQEKYAAAGLASMVESLGSMAALGATTAATLPLVAFAVNNAWIEGANSWVDDKGNVYDSKDAATQAAGKDNIRQLTTAENATRAALMGTAEFVGEKFGLPGMRILMKGIPIGGTAGDILNAVKSAGFGLASEQISELLTTVMQIDIDKMKNIGLGQNATPQNVADALKDTFFTTLWAVGGSSTVGTASTALKNVSTDPIPQFQSPVLPEDVWIRAKDAGLTDSQINTLKAEASSLSSVGEINKIEADFRANLASAGFTPQEIERLTTPAVTNAVNTSVVDLLKTNGVPAGQIANVASQVTTQLMSGGDPVTVSRNLLDIFDQNKIDPTKANTMAADYTGLMTTAQVQKIVSDAIAANPSITPTQINAAISTAVKDFATVQNIKDAISGITFPAGLSKTDVTSAISSYMAANPGLSLADVSSKIVDATKGLATSAGVNTSISDALKGYATTADIKSAIAGIQFPVGITTADVTTAISNYMKANPGLSISDVASKITDATKGLATTSDVKDSISSALKGYATAADISSAIANIKFPAGITSADVTSAIKSYMTANPGLSLAEVAGKIAESTKGLATDTSVQNAISTALKDVATKSDISAAISGIKFPAGISKDDVTSAIQNYMKANPGLSITDVAGKIAESTKGLATDTGVQTAISTALKGYATAADITKAISNIQFPAGLSKTDVADQIKSVMAANPGLSSADVTKSITDYMTANPGLTATDMKSAIDSATKNLVTSTVLNTALAGVSTDVKAKFDTLTQAQKDAVTSQIQQGKDLTQAITDATTGLQTQITGLSATTKAQYDSLSQAQKDAVASQVQQGKDLTKSIADTASGLQTQITGLSTTTKAQYDALTQAQKDAVNAQVQQGKDLTKAITDTASGLQTQITGLSTTAKAQYDALTQAQKDVVAAQVQQGKDLTKSIADTASGLQTQITGLSAETKAQYDALTQAQKDAVAAQAQQGKDLTKAITDTAAGLQTQVAGLSTELQTKYDALTQGQKDIVAQQTQQGIDIATAIAEATKTTTEQIANVKTDLTTNITNVQTQFNTRVDELMKQGQDQQTATQNALKELGTGVTGLQTNITGLQTNVTDIQKAQADAAAKAEAAAKASRAGVAQSGIASNLAKAAAAVGAGAAAATVIDDSIPGYKDIGLKNTGGNTGFESALSPFEKMVKEDTFAAKSNEPQAQTQQQQGAQMSENLNIQNPQTENTDYFSYGNQSDINKLLSNSASNQMSFYKDGGLATPLFAGGGTTRHGRFAGGGLNVVEHSGKARLDFRTGNAVTGAGDGQSDDIPAMLADGEFVFPADVVAALGNGSTKAGSDKLYDMMHSIRAYHRSAKPKDLPPPAKKSPLDYLKKPAKSARS